MDPTEAHVLRHLKDRGYLDVVYEPDGNVPPDFLVNRNIAVEVRRLNQNFHSANGVSGLEEESIPLWKKMDKLLKSFGPPRGSGSWFIYFRFARPIDAWKTIEPPLRCALEAFLSSPGAGQSRILKLNGFEVDVYCKTTTSHPQIFVLAGGSDRDSGGWLLAEMANNIQYCARVKAQKIDHLRQQYSTWWLALVDHIGYGLDEYDRQMFREKVSIEHTWDKIFVIDPRDHCRWFEI